MEEVQEVMDIIKEKLEERPYVIGISRSYEFIPYMRPSKYYYKDSVRLASGEKILAHIKATDESAEKVFNPDIIRGRWFLDGELIDGRYPAVVSEQFAEASGLSDILGKMIYFRGGAFVVTGIVSGIKEMPLEDAPPCVVFPIGFFYPEGSVTNWQELSARIRPGYEDEFISDYYKEYNCMVGEELGAECRASSLSVMENKRMENALVSMASSGIAALFFLIFTVLGTIGINLMDVKERLREFALRISIGSTRRKVIALFLMQNAIMSVISAIPGIAVILSIYPLETSLPVISFTLVLTLLVSLSCAAYPAFTVLRIKPSELLRME